MEPSSLAGEAAETESEAAAVRDELSLGDSGCWGCSCSLGLGFSSFPWTAADAAGLLEAEVPACAWVPPLGLAGEAAGLLRCLLELDEPWWWCFLLDLPESPWLRILSFLSSGRFSSVNVGSLEKSMCIMSSSVCSAILRSSSLSLVSKQMRKVLCMISHTLSLVRSSPTGDSRRVRRTSRIFMRTISSELGSTPTKRAWVTASARPSTACAAPACPGCSTP